MQQSKIDVLLKIPMSKTLSPVPSAPILDKPKHPHTQALKQLWLDVRYRLYTPRFFWTWFDLSRRFDLTFLRLSNVNVAIPRGILPDCENCLDICCTGKNAIVSLRFLDIAKLIDTNFAWAIDTHLPTTNTGTDTKISSGTITGIRSNKDANTNTQARKIFQETLFYDVFPVLHHDATNTCVLLDDDRMCRVYPQWPLSCARYPYALDKKHNTVFYAHGCQSRLTQVESASSLTGKQRALVQAVLDSYNERIKDVILLHTALDELHEIGVLRYVRLTGNLADKAKQRGLVFAESEKN